jgi:hypothetical protein
MNKHAIITKLDREVNRRIAAALGWHIIDHDGGYDWVDKDGNSNGGFQWYTTPKRARESAPWPVWSHDMDAVFTLFKDLRYTFECEPDGVPTDPGFTYRVTIRQDVRIVGTGLANRAALAFCLAWLDMTEKQA